MTITTRSFAAAALTAAALMLGVSQTAEAALFLKLAANAASVSCDNGTAAGVAACSANGFSTSLDSNLITYSGAVGGYDVFGMNLGSNAGGSSSPAFVDAKFGATHTAGADDLQISFAAYNFVQPIGPALLLTAAQSATWTTAVVGDTAKLQTFVRTDNLPAIPGGTATASAPTVTSPGGPAVESSQSIEVPFTRLATPFSLTAVETIHQAIGDSANYTVSATAAAAASGSVSAQAAVPEPSSVLLLGTGVLGLAYWRRKRQ